MLWENTTNEEVLERARAEIRRSWCEVCELNKDHPQAAELFNPDKLPALHDPFAGGGAIPLEAQRLGLEAYASDLNPVAVLINKAMIEIPPKFANCNLKLLLYRITRINTSIFHFEVPIYFRTGPVLHPSSFILHTSPIAPVDLSQAVIGPGMAVFSKYAAVLEADGSPMSVRTALQLINRFLAEDDFDADTQFCLHWFEQHGWTESAFGEADVLARSKSTSVDAMKEAEVLQSGSGKVRLLK